MEQSTLLNVGLWSGREKKKREIGMARKRAENRERSTRVPRTGGLSVLHGRRRKPFGTNIVEEVADAVWAMVEREPPDSFILQQVADQCHASWRFRGHTQQENVMANAFWVSVGNNILKRWNTIENDVSKNQSSGDSAVGFPNTSILNLNSADITAYFYDVPNYIILNIL
ncbi:hypothetical protein TNCV_889761 [Trichonephila clavipes]|nr:hypothetical protein TNCV_889761 [Trichonephila clavipes]